MNKNNEYNDQIEYKTSTLTCGTLLGWHVDIKKIKQNLKKKSKKLRIDKWQSLFIIVNNLNNVRKNDQIEKKLTKIVTDWTQKQN